MRESKEKIKSRMIKNASRLWGFQDTQAEGSFDPFVGMIIGALSGELEKVSEQIAGTESRVVEKLVELLTPDPITGPVPAHSLISAIPSQPNFTIDSLYQFYLYKKRSIDSNSNKNEEKTIFFSPTGKYKLFQGRVNYIATGDKLFEVKKNVYKDVCAVSQTKLPVSNSILWIGLELNSQLESLEGLSLYFDLRNEMYQNDFYQALYKGNWSINGQAIQIEQGFYKTTENTRTELDNFLLLDMSTTAKICSHINRFYQKKVFTIKQGDAKIESLMVAERFPSVFEKTFNLEDLKAMDKPLIWIKVELPNTLPTDVLEDINCNINCFPVMNRHLNSFTQTSKEFINIIPLQSEDTFLDMNSVTNSEGKVYTQKFFSSRGEVTKGSYILRQGGVGRFDSRDAMEIINYLLELLRDESAAFAVLGADMISSNLRELNQTIARMENRLKESNTSKEKTSYLMLKARSDDDIVFVEFWSTQGTFANQIKAGSTLTIYEGSDIMPDSVSFVTTTIGGRDSMDTEERINTYRKTLLSHGRVVTAEDIKAVGYEHFGNVIKNIEVKKGFMNSAKAGQGFVQTIDVHINFDKRKTAFKEDEIKYFKEDFLVKLEERSANILPYRCFVNGIDNK
ncbi:hypothetical protein E9993_19990 [Labilibacter sediminis]|nr:hypothetical protein E9993_19990 [Labilibacter sediminis]